MTSLVVIVSLIAATKTQEGMLVRAEIDKVKYPEGRKITGEGMARINLRPDKFQG